MLYLWYCWSDYFLKCFLFKNIYIFIFKNLFLISTDQNKLKQKLKIKIKINLFQKNTFKTT
jgi:hypothetical protein